MSGPITASIIIPTYNGAEKIGGCLDALRPQVRGKGIEILVVDDGSSDATASVVFRYPEVRLIHQTNAGPAAARNRGAREAGGEIIIFTDDDCVPAPGWLDAMLCPFETDSVVGAKGIYLTPQRGLTARFVQTEYEDKYRLMADLPAIDFVDTYSAAFRRGHFLQIGGYDTSFPVACAEDVELSYRMSAEGWLMKFVPGAIVGHTHPDSLLAYFKKKYKFAFWRMYAVKKHPTKGVKDSHTPQLMKLQLLLVPALLLAGVLHLLLHIRYPLAAIVMAVFFTSTVPFSLRAFRKDPHIGILAPFYLAVRSIAQFLGVSAGAIYCQRRRTAMMTTAGKAS